jgi:hypothetical protein
MVISQMRLEDIDVILVPRGSLQMFWVQPHVNNVQLARIPLRDPPPVSPIFLVQQLQTVPIYPSITHLALEAQEQRCINGFFPKNAIVRMWRSHQMKLALASKIVYLENIKARVNANIVCQERSALEAYRLHVHLVLQDFQPLKLSNTSPIGLSGIQLSPPVVMEIVSHMAGGTGIGSLIQDMDTVMVLNRGFKLIRCWTQVQQFGLILPCLATATVICLSRSMVQ